MQILKLWANMKLGQNARVEDKGITLSNQI